MTNSRALTLLQNRTQNYYHTNPLKNVLHKIIPDDNMNSQEKCKKHNET